MCADEEEDARTFFRAVKPHCLQILSALAARTVETTISDKQIASAVETLTLVLPSLPPAGIPKCREYLYIPLFQVARCSGVAVQVREQCLQCLCDIEQLFRSNRGGRDVNPNILAEVLTIFRADMEVIMGASTSSVSLEEISSQLLGLYTTILQDPSESERDYLLSQPFFAAFGHSLFLVLSIAEGTGLIRSKSVRSQALTLTFNAVEKVLRYNRGAIAKFMPGIASKMSRIATGDYKQGHEVTALALKTFAATITAGFSDESNMDYLKNSLNVDSLADARLRLLSIVGGGDSQEDVTKPKKTERMDSGSSPSSDDRSGRVVPLETSEEWFQSTRTNLGLVTERLFKPSSTIMATSGTRIASIDAAWLILSKCQRSLSDSTNSGLISWLVRHVLDDMTDVRDQAVRLVEALKNSNLKLTELCKDGLSRVLEILPRSAMAEEVDVMVSNLRSVGGYLLFLGERTPALLEAKGPCSLPRVIRALASVIDFEAGNAKIVEQRTPRYVVQDMEVTGVGKVSSTSLFAQQDKQFQKVLTSVCRHLGQYASFHSLQSHVMRVLEDKRSARYHRHTLYILNQALRGAIAADAQTDNVARLNQRNLKIVTSFVDDCLDLDLWAVETSNAFGGDGSGSATVETLHRNITTVCLLLDGLAIAADCLGLCDCKGTRDYELFLLKTLYLVLERVGSDSALVSQFGVRCLESYARCGGFDSIQSLLVSNADYLVDSLCQSMRTTSVASLVLQATLNYGGSQMLALMEDAIQVVFDSVETMSLHEAMYADTLCTLQRAILARQGGSLDDFQKVSDLDYSPPSERWGEILEVFRKELWVVKANREPATWSPLEIVDVLRYESSEWAGVAESGGAGDGETPKELGEEHFKRDTEQEEDMPRDEEEAPLDKHQIMTKSIMEKCVYLLTTSNLKPSLVILETVSMGLKDLSDRESALLPTIHSLWGPIVACLKQENVNVVVRTLDLLAEIVQLAGDFVRRRFQDDAWAVLEKCTTRPIPADENVHRPEFRLHSTILKFLLQVSVSPHILANSASGVARACLVYIKEGAHPLLKDLGVALFQRLCLHDPDAIWIIVRRADCDTTAKHSILQLLADLPEA